MQNKNLIKWTRSDYITLGKAVANFNKKINELNKEEKKLYLPQQISYKDLKSNIYSRKNLKSTIESLKNFLLDGAEELIKLDNEITITQWELNEIESSNVNANKRIRKELNKKGIGRFEKIELERRLELINNLYNKSGWDFTRTSRLIRNIGSTDYNLRKATIYKNNFLNALEQLSSFDNYNLLVGKLNKIKNPISFYNYVNKSEVLSDLFLWYEKKGKAYIYGAFNNNQEAFNYALEELDLTG